MFLETAPRYRVSALPRVYELTASMPFNTLSRPRPDVGVLCFQRGAFDDVLGDVEVRINHHTVVSGHGVLSATPNELQLWLQLDADNSQHKRLIDNATAITGISLATDEGIQQLAIRALAGEPLSTLGTDAVALVGRLANAREHLRIAQAAETLAYQRVETARAAALEAVVPVARERYAETVNAVARALITLKQAAASEVAVRDVYDGPTGIRLFPTRIHSMMIPYDIQRVGSWIAEGVEHGLLPSSVLAEYNAMCRGGDYRIV